MIDSLESIVDKKHLKLEKLSKYFNTTLSLSTTAYLGGLYCKEYYPENFGNNSLVGLIPICLFSIIYGISSKISNEIIKYKMKK